MWGRAASPALLPQERERPSRERESGEAKERERVTWHEEVRTDDVSDGEREGGGAGGREGVLLVFGCGGVGSDLFDNFVDFHQAVAQTTHTATVGLLRPFSPFLSLSRSIAPLSLSVVCFLHLSLSSFLSPPSLFS